MNIRQAMRIMLEAGSLEGVRRFVTALPIALSLDGEKPQTWVTVTRTGSFYDPRYGDFEITRPMLLQMVDNFDKGTYGQDIFIDVAHEPSKGAAAKVLKLAVEGTKLRALLEWTPYGVDAVRSRGFRYLSADYHENWQDNEKRAQHGPLLFGAGLTIRPVIKGLDPIQLSEPDGTPPTFLHPSLQTELTQEIHIMWKELIKKLSEALNGFKLAAPVVATLAEAAEKALAGITDEAQAKILLASFEESGKKLAEQIGDKVVQLSIAVPNLQSGLTAADVQKLMRDEAVRLQEEATARGVKLASNVSVLTTALASVADFDDGLRKELADAVSDLITPEMTEAQVKKLAETQISMGNKLVAAKKLSSMGFAWPKGSAHISVDSSNEVKSLQEVADKRLGYAGMSDARRFKSTEGKLQAENKEFAEKVLAQFDAIHGAQLHAEHKLLAAGDGKVSDVAVPATFERTVIREALYNLVGLQFVDVGTAEFAASTLIPYSYRDITAAGRSNTRVYEGGAIPRAGVKQTSDTAYPIPQKLAFEVTDELRYLTTNGQLINWDAVAENARNAQRIISEDLEQLIFNEILNAADQYATTAVVNEAVATADGTKTIFVLDHFPVVRPKSVYDLQGNQVGSTLYPITVEDDGTAVDEYDGTNTQAAGLYYTMDYNLGEVHFVSELGVATAPTNTDAIVASYNYTTNVYTFDTDLGSATVKDKWDDFLYRYGLRKSVIEDQRSYMANFGLMSGTVMTSVEQAGSFVANFARTGTDLTNEGNLGRVKNVANYKAYAPGLSMGDQRIVIGERSQTRFRMAKPWTMGQLQDQKDSNGRFTGKKEAYGDQFLFLHTPTPLKAAYTGIALYSSSARVDRA